MASLLQSFFHSPWVGTAGPRKENALATADCTPIPAVPRASRLFQDFCAGFPGARVFYGAQTELGEWMKSSQRPAHWPELVDELAAQNPHATAALDVLRSGGGAVVTGQQVGLFGGPLLTALKAGTAIARARQATAAGHPHAAIFWLASEDHDFDEINHVIFPARRVLKTLEYKSAPADPRPVGGLVLDETIAPLLEQAWELLGYSEAMQALEAAYKPGRTFAQAFAEFYSKIFAAQGLLVFDASSRQAHRMGAPVLQAAIDTADQMHAALLMRNQGLAAVGYHAQVAVGPESSLLFLIDAQTGARHALKRHLASASEPSGLWQAGSERYTSDDLRGILAAEPERISPSALLRPLFQDFLLGTSLIIGGPAEIAYFAQSEVLYQRVLGRMTAVEPRFSATLVEPGIAEQMRHHELSFERLLTESPDSLAQLMAARAMPVEGKQLLSNAGNALNAELEPLLAWMQTVDEGLGRSGATAANKMRYQMNRMRRLAANFQLSKEDALRRRAQAITNALLPGGVLQERVHGAAWYFAHHGLQLAETIATHAASNCNGHMLVWL